MTPAKPARFYKDVSAAEADGSFEILLDGRPAKTPGRSALRVPNETLAKAIAAEWRWQREHIDPATMPLTGLACAAIDLVQHHRGKVIDHILGFGRSDLLCYRAEPPSELSHRQATAWNPCLEWLKDAYGVTLQVGAGVSFVEQPVGAQLEFERVVSALNDFELAAFDKASGITGSFVLGLAILGCRLRADEAFALSRVDEDFQAEKWGRDPEAESRRAQLRSELEAVERFLEALRSSA